MLVGKINVDIGMLEKKATNIKDFVAYSDSLVPEYIRHIPAVVYNQRYLCCLLLRKSSVKWDIKKAILNEVMRDIRLVGYTDHVIEADTLLGFVNKERLEKWNNKE